MQNDISKESSCSDSTQTSCPVSSESGKQSDEKAINDTASSAQHSCSDDTQHGDTSTKDTPNDRSKTSDIIIYVLTWIFRLGLGGTFIYSGIVKAIDPWGTIYKLHDYIEAMPNGLFAWALPLLTPVAFALFTIEILLGVSVLTGSYRRLSAIGSLIMMLIMTPLTLWIALKNPVADCGCFGDALILTNWQTFWKNIVLLSMSVWLVIYNNRARCLISTALQWLMVLACLCFAVSIGFIGYSIQPMVDFRPYPVGSTLVDTSAELDASTDDDMMAIWQNGDKQITIPADSIPQGDEWEFIDRVSNTAGSDKSEHSDINQKGIAIYDGQDDITEDIIPGEGEAVVVFMTDLPNLSKGNYYKLNSLDDYCKHNDVNLIVVAAATPLQIQDFAAQSWADYPIYTAEDTAIKEVVRGNPGFVYLKDGKIVYKASFSALPTYDFKQDTPNKPGALEQYKPFADKGLFKGICLIFLSFIALIAILSHVPMVIRFTARKIKSSKWVKAGDVVKCFALAIVSGCCFSSCSSDEPELPYDDNERTILIYMVATNSLSGDSQDDVDEILRGYEDCLDDINTTILIYRTCLGQEYPSLYQVAEARNGKAELVELRRYDNSASSVSTFRIGEVINDMRRYAPADEYGLFLWSHASAWVPADVATKSVDTYKAPVYYSFGDDYGKNININDLAAAIPQNLFSFIWMDCCYMGSIEVVYQLRNHCKTIVAYPTEVLQYGAPYDKIMPFIATSQFSLEKAAEATFNYYAQNSNSSLRSCTVSITSTEELDKLAAVCRSIIKEGYKIQSTIGLQTFGRFHGVTFYDFGQVYSTLAGTDIQHINALNLQLSETVVFKLATSRFQNTIINPDNFSGLSCHIPGLSSNQYYETYYKSLDWYKAIY